MLKRRMIPIVMMLASITGCGKTNEDHGKFYKLSEAYSLGLFSREDLLNIAYHYNKQVNVNDPDFVPGHPEKMTLDQETASRVVEAHRQRLLGEGFEAENAPIKLRSYYGKYNDCYAIWVEDQVHHCDVMVWKEYLLDGVKFLTFCDGQPYGMEIWKYPS